MERKLPEFTSRQSRAEWILALLWLPLHLFGLPLLLLRLFPTLDAAWLNFYVYLVGAVFMLGTQFRFLRRDFDPLCERFGSVLLEVIISYGAMMLFNMVVTGLLSLALETIDNPNNAQLTDLARVNRGTVAAVAVYLAPIVEELIFRAGVFGALRHKNRVLGYVVSIALFAVYHIWGYALSDPIAWLYALQYLPISFLLCRIYERTNTIWSSILLHMLVNTVALHALELVERLL